MTKEIQITTEEYNSIPKFIGKKDTGNLQIGINRKTYGGLISLEGTPEEVELFCCILEDNGISADR